MLIVFVVSPLVFSWGMLGFGSSSAASLLPNLEKGVFLPSLHRTHPARVTVVALKVTGLVSISRNAAIGSAT